MRRAKERRRKGIRVGRVGVREVILKRSFSEKKNESITNETPHKN
jgi:hypothetical protein